MPLQGAAPSWHQERIRGSTKDIYAKCGRPTGCVTTAFIYCGGFQTFLSKPIYIYTHTHTYIGFPGVSDGKESTCNAGDLGSIPGLGRSPGEENGNPTPAFLPGKSHGQRSLVGYRPMGSQRVEHH